MMMLQSRVHIPSIPRIFFQIDQATPGCNSPGKLAVYVSKSRAHNGIFVMETDKYSQLVGAADVNVPELGPSLVLVDADVCEQFFRISRICIELIRFHCMFPFVKIDLRSLDGGFASRRWTRIRLLHVPLNQKESLLAG